MNITLIGINKLSYCNRIYICQNTSAKKKGQKSDVEEELPDKLYIDDKSKFKRWDSSHNYLEVKNKKLIAGQIPGVFEHRWALFEMNLKTSEIKMTIYVRNVVSGIKEVQEQKVVKPDEESYINLIIGMVEIIGEIVCIKYKDSDYLKAGQKDAVLQEIKSLQNILCYLNALYPFKDILEKHSDDERIVAIIYAVGEIRDTGSALLLLKVLVALKDADNEYSGIRNELVAVLVKMGDEKLVPKLIESLGLFQYDNFDSIVDVLIGIGKKVDIIPQMIEVLEDKNIQNEQVVVGVLRILAEIGDKRTTEPLIVYLKEEKHNQLLVVGALGQTRDQRAVPALIEMLEYEDINIKESIILALGKIGGTKAVAKLIEFLKSDLLKLSALIALRNTEDRSAVPAIIESLRDDRKRYPENSLLENFRALAAVTLGEIGDKRAIPVLIVALKDTNELVQEEAVKALEKIGDRKAVAALIATFKDTWFFKHYEASQALVSLKKYLNAEEDCPVLLDIIKKGKFNYEVRINIVICLEQIALNYDNGIKNEILEVFKDRLGIGLFNPQEEKDPLVLEALRKAYNKIKESLKKE